jgi:hypothetical protein
MTNHDRTLKTLHTGNVLLTPKYAKGSKHADKWNYA